MRIVLDENEKQFIIEFILNKTYSKNDNFIDIKLMSIKGEKSEVFCNFMYPIDSIKILKINKK